MFGKKYLLIIALFVVNSILANDNIVYNHLGFEAELSEITFNGLYQDEKGILWIGTKDGVRNFNGVSVEPIQLNGLNSIETTNLIPTICGDRKGHVYMNVNNSIVEYSLQNSNYKIIFSALNKEKLTRCYFNYDANMLWIGLRDTIYTYRNNKKSVYTSLTDKNSNITFIKATSNEKLYIGTNKRGLFCIDSEKNETQIIDDCGRVVTIYEDNKKNIWVGTFDKGLYCVAADGTIRNFSSDLINSNRLSSNYVRSICEDDNGYLWIASMLGIDKLDLKSFEIRKCNLYENGKSGQSNLSVWVIMKDNQGTMWFGTFNGGLNYFNPKSISFSFNDFGTHYSDNGYPFIGQIQQDKRGDYWMCTEGKGLLFYSPKRNFYRFLSIEGKSIPVKNIKSLYYDYETDKLWIGTHLHGLSSLNIKTMTFKKFDIDINSGSEESEVVHAITKYKNTLFIGTILGVYEMDLKTEKIKPVDKLRNKVTTLTCFYIDKSNHLWIAGRNLITYDLTTYEIVNHSEAIQKVTLTSLNLATALYQDTHNRIIVAIKGYGLLAFNEKYKTFKQLNNTNKELLNSYIRCLGETSNGYLLAGSNNGLSAINSKNGNCYNYNSQNGFPLLSMSPGSIYKVNNAEILLSGINGVSFFNANFLISTDVAFNLHFSKLWVNNKLVSPGDETEILRDEICFTPKIILQHNQNALSIEIGHDNFAMLGHSVFEYKLINFDEKWTQFNPKSPIKYMNLPYGKYTLQVRAKFENVLKSPKSELVIIVKPPVYGTWYAYLIYLILITAISGWLIRLSRARLLLQTTLAYEMRDKEQKERINQSKLRFFANISHELRTPLTLILGQLELFMTKKTAKNQQYKLHEIYKSASNMNNLINELLDFQKYDQGMFRLQVKNIDIVNFSKEIYSSFQSYAELKHIDFNFSTIEHELLVWFDPVQLKKVLNNLLVNAFKYTPEQGKIEISILKQNEYVLINIKDNGIGISEAYIHKIFDRFYQVENSINTEIQNTGTGIGLSLSQSIMNAHFGSLNVISELEKGSQFTIKILLGLKHFEGDEMIEIESSVNQQILNAATHLVNDELQADVNNDLISTHVSQSTLLIVEDDEPLRKLLLQIFDPIFITLEASNGADGLAIANSKMPDLILSDVMMPGMNGYEFCTKVKSNFETCHIPIILLTALNSIEQNISGINSGADDYVTKPFHTKLLIVKCISLLNNRKLLQEKFSKQLDEMPSTLTTNALDQDFVEKAIVIIEQNIENAEINVSLLCKELAISRTILFAKMKGITGQTPHEFIQGVKLKMAAKMIKENPQKKIIDISEHFGYSSLNHFGKLFKEYFGISPMKMRSKNKETE